jgi:hypothetical protein
MAYGHSWNFHGAVSCLQHVVEGHLPPSAPGIGLAHRASLISSSITFGRFDGSILVFAYCLFEQLGEGVLISPLIISSFCR